MQADTFYHIYNHANGDENLFRTDENYRYFLQLWEKHITPVASSYAYCLMPNHFHFLVRIKPEEELVSFFKIADPGFENLSGLLSKRFSNCFNAYTKAFNKMYDRRGSLFIRPFKRKEINSETYLTAIVNYIHRNPIHHGFTTDLNSWKFSSYHACLSKKATQIDKEYVLEWFNGKEDFIKYHQEHQVLNDTSLLIDS